MPDAETQRLWHDLARCSSLVNVVEEGLRSLTEEERQALLARLGWVQPPGPGWTLTNVTHRQSRQDRSIVGPDGVFAGAALDVCVASATWERAAQGEPPEPPCRACADLATGTCQVCGRVVEVTISGRLIPDGLVDPTTVEFTDSPESGGPLWDAIDLDPAEFTSHYMPAEQTSGPSVLWDVPVGPCDGYHDGDDAEQRDGWRDPCTVCPSPGPTDAVDSSH